MASRARTEAACFDSIISEPLPRVSRPVDVTDAALFPGLAQLSRDYAALSPERRAELEKEWSND